MAFFVRIVSTVSSIYLALVLSGPAHAESQPTDANEKPAAATAEPKTRITTREAIQVLRELTASFCGQPSECSFTIDPRGPCPFDAFVQLPANFLIDGKPAPVLRIGLDQRGALIGMMWAPSPVCART